MHMSSKDYEQSGYGAIYLMCIPHKGWDSRMHN
jgi:hypothetical protein